MHWTQAVYIGLLLLALASSWRQPWSALIAAVMVGNLVATMTLAVPGTGPLQFLFVGFADAVCATLLMRGNRRAMKVATLFSVMIPVYVSGWWFSWPDAITYTIIDLVAYVQLGVIGGLDSGIWHRGRAAARRWRLPDDPAPQGGHAAIGVARVFAQGEVKHERG